MAALTLLVSLLITGPEPPMRACLARGGGVLLYLERGPSILGPRSALGGSLVCLVSCFWGVCLVSLLGNALMYMPGVMIDDSSHSWRALTKMGP